MTIGRAPVSAVVFLVLSAVVGAGAALFTLAFLTEYGTTSGSWADGALDGLELAVVPLLAIGALAAAALGLGRRSAWVRGLAIAVVLLSLGGVLAGGAQAAVAKYDRLPRLPACNSEDFDGSPAEPVVRAVQEAFSGLEHPGRFGGVSTGIDGCGTTLLNVTFDEAVAHYRQQLPATGWDVTRDDESGVTARRDDLVFVLIQDRCGSVAIAIRPREAHAFLEGC